MALYHTHRPQSFDSVVGQQHIVQTIKNQITAEKVAHAYLFFGPRGIGKTTTARLLAKAMNCTERPTDSAEPCNTCGSCTEIARGAALDVIEIDAASHTGVDNVRENIIENAQFKPTKSKMKVFIIDEVHMLSTSAFNALLKTLEEPPAHVLFILATTELHKLPDTIISRCQRFTFSKIPADMLQAYLTDIASKENVTVETSVLAHIVAKSEGCARDAVSLLEQVMATGEKHITAESAAFLLPPSATEEVTAFTTALSENKASAALGVLQDVYTQGIQFPLFTDDLIGYLRTILLVQASPAYEATLTLDTAAQKTIKSLADAFEPIALVGLIDACIAARGKIKQSPIPQLPLELVVIEKTAQSDTVSQSPSHTVQKDTAIHVPKKETPKPATKVQNSDAPTPKKKESIVTKVKKSMSSSAKGTPITLDAAKSSWPAFISAIEKDSPALTFILKLAEVVDADGNTLVLAVDHTFHRDKLMDKDCMKKLESMLEPIYNQKVHLRITLKKENDKQEQKQELDALANAFGGEVVA